MKWSEIGYIRESTDTHIEEEDGIIIVEDIRKRWNDLHPCPKKHPDITKLEKEVKKYKDLYNKLFDVHTNSIEYKIKDLLFNIKKKIKGFKR